MAEAEARLLALSDWLSAAACPDEPERQGECALNSETTENDRSSGWFRTLTGREVLMESSFSLPAETDGGGFTARSGAEHLRRRVVDGRGRSDPEPVALGDKAKRFAKTRSCRVRKNVAAAHIKELTGKLSPASVKQHLAALRMLFDWLVVGQVLPFNPASSVRGPKHVVKKGKTPVLSAEEARELLDEIDLSTLAGLRDRALIGVLVFSFARITAAVSMRVSDYHTQRKRSFFRLHEKGGRYNVVPAHHLAQEYVDAYLEAAEFGEDRKGPLFRSCPPGRQDRLEYRAMSRATALRMIKRRARKTGLPAEICAHSFRGTGITEYLRNGGDLEVAAQIAGHESTRTTQLYNRIQDENALDVIERIHIRERAECNVGGVCAYLWRAKRLGIDARTCLPRTLLVAGYRLNPSTSRNPVQNPVTLQSRFNLREHGIGDPADALREKPPVQGDDLRDVNHRLFRQACPAPGERNVAGSGR